MSTAQARVKWLEGTLSLGIAGKHSVAIDRPESAGGTEAGFRASELLLLSLAGCFSSTLAGATKARNLTLAKADIDVTAKTTTAPDRFSEFELTVDLTVTDAAGVALSAEDLDKLVEIAERGCFITNTLKANTPVTIRRVQEVALIS